MSNALYFWLASFSNSGVGNSMNGWKLSVGSWGKSCSVVLSSGSHSVWDLDSLSSISSWSLSITVESFESFSVFIGLGGDGSNLLSCISSWSSCSIIVGDSCSVEATDDSSSVFIGLGGDGSNLISFISSWSCSIIVGDSCSSGSGVVYSSWLVGSGLGGETSLYGCESDYESIKNVIFY